MSKFKVGSRVKYKGGYTGTVVAVVPVQVRYKVKWDPATIVSSDVAEEYIDAYCDIGNHVYKEVTGDE